MDNGVDATQGVSSYRAIREVAANELNLSWQARTLSRAPIVENNQVLRAFRRQMMDKVGSNEARAPGYEYPHS